ncbi:MAG: hypothetical protein IPL27_23395 [Lewinellaceae bacterium]|nr:hypothetical protein [Lewinellaceae bacterium]
MANSNLDIINKFFEAYNKRDIDNLRLVLADNAKWTSLGQHPFSGVRNGFNEVIAFFDVMGAIMGSQMLVLKNLLLAKTTIMLSNVNVFGQTGMMNTILTTWFVCCGSLEIQKLLKVDISSQTQKQQTIFSTILHL